MNDVKVKSGAMARRPAEVPHHPKVLVVGGIIAAAALFFMMAWFWQVMTGPGLIMTQESAQEAADPAEEQLQSDLDRQAESSQQQLDAPVAKGGPPEAPDENVPVTDELELTGYSILSVNGILQVGGTLTNVSSAPLTGTVKVYVYTDAVPVATAKTEIKNLQPGASESVNMVSDSDWEAGEKVILLDFIPVTAEKAPKKSN